MAASFIRCGTIFAARKCREGAHLHHEEAEDEHAGQDRRKAGQDLRDELGRLGKQARGCDSAEEDAGDDAERHRDQRAQPDHHQRADHGVAEAAAPHEAGRRQLGEQVEAQTRPAAHNQQVEHRNERHGGDDCHDPEDQGEDEVLRRARLNQGAAHVGGGAQRECDRGGQAFGDGHDDGALPTTRTASTTRQ
jgi:hypothetical protein